MTDDIRWHQRLASYRKALGKLTAAVTLARSRPLSDLEKLGLIQSFEFTHELAWNLMKDWLAWQGNAQVGGSRDATREAFAQGLIQEGEVWMEMIKSRNQSSHTYNEKTAEEIHYLVIFSYHREFVSLLERMENELDDLLLPWKIDLSLLHHIDNPDLLDHIRRVGVSLAWPLDPGIDSTDLP